MKSMYLYKLHLKLQKIKVTLVKDALKLTVSATADYATYFTVDFGNGQDPVDLQKTRKFLYL